MSLLKTLMEMMEITETEARQEIREAKAELRDRLARDEMPYDLCGEYWGLEPDYLMELM